jgi:Holliday junction resolvase RusA-like endonuclease
MPIAPPIAPQSWVCFTIPKPFSANKMTANVPGKGRVKTADYRAWLTEAGWAIRQQFSPLPQYNGYVFIDIDLPRGMDIDNPQKALFDLLQKPQRRRLKQGLGIIVDDNMIDKLTIRRVPADHPFTVRLRAA